MAKKKINLKTKKIHKSNRKYFRFFLLAISPVILAILFFLIKDVFLWRQIRSESQNKNLKVTISPRPSGTPMPTPTPRKFSQSVPRYHLREENTSKDYIKIYSLIDNTNTKVSDLIDVPRKNRSVWITGLSDNGFVFYRDSEKIYSVNLLTYEFKILYEVQKGKNIFESKLSPDQKKIYISVSKKTEYDMPNDNELYEIDINDRNVRRVGVFHSGAYTVFTQLDHIDGYDIIIERGGDACSSIADVYKSVSGVLQPILDAIEGCGPSNKYIGYIPSLTSVLVGKVKPNEDSWQTEFSSLYLFNVKTLEWTKLIEFKNVQIPSKFEEYFNDKLLTEDTVSNNKNLLKVEGQKASIQKTFKKGELDSVYNGKWLNNNELLIYSYGTDRVFMDFSTYKLKIIELPKNMESMFLGYWNGSLVQSSLLDTSASQ